MDKKLLGYIGLGCNALATILALIFSSVTCSRSAGSAFRDIDADDAKFKLSLACIVCFIAAAIAVAGLVLTILSAEKGQALGVVATISLCLGIFALFYSIVPVITSCSYGCILTKKLNNLY
ncbi:hypothetical protein SAMN02910289_01133 [Lachnospiraceae bacterium RM5]|nr:hypothetical protein SAMN02910289_01133 [Lachnospiraceae bacterium RM5]